MAAARGRRTAREREVIPRIMAVGFRVSRGRFVSGGMERKERRAKILRGVRSVMSVRNVGGECTRVTRGRG